MYVCVHNTLTHSGVPFRIPRVSSSLTHINSSLCRRPRADVLLMQRCRSPPIKSERMPCTSLSLSASPPNPGTLTGRLPLSSSSSSWRTTEATTRLYGSPHAAVTHHLFFAIVSR
eukprot:GHVU01213657.1.p1 GENE.GHVU01213657.1~~GHVU01213657.1.p1  ORF type:complete len:115 (+),score=8.06 GHVU01213657.1:211-555(+)